MKDKVWSFFITALVVGMLALIFGVQAAAAQGTTPDNQTCLACHGNPGMQTQLPNGDILYLTVDPKMYQNSVHGNSDIACTQCHTNISGFPHPALAAQDRRDVTILMYQTTCINCHKDKYDFATNDAHKEARDAGNKNAAVCSDCHGAHDITKPDEPRSRIPQTCSQCHSKIFDLYKTSVHGQALIGEGNPDVPSCVDCHNAHNVQGPTNTQFRLFSPNICARCHDNKELMAKYGINTDVFQTYLTDFHGTTVEMFQATAPGQETNKPVCIDCHGVHDMKKVDNPESTVIKDRVLTTCKKCHPDATTNFPGAWLSHYPPSPSHNSLVYYINLVYKVLIPGTVGALGIYVVSDAVRRIANRRKGARHG